TIEIRPVMQFSDCLPPNPSIWPFLVRLNNRARQTVSHETNEREVTQARSKIESLVLDQATPSASLPRLRGTKACFGEPPEGSSRPADRTYLELVTVGRAQRETVNCLDLGYPL